MNVKYCSAIGPLIDRFVTLKRSLGLNYVEQANILLALDRFLTDSCSSHDLTAEAFRDWCQSFTRLSDTVRRMWMQTVRDLCLYRHRSEPGCFIPDAATFPARHQAIRPYIFSPAEIRRLLDQSCNLARHPYSPMRPELFRLIIVLLFTTGLRHRELLRLTVGDYDPIERTLLIRASKFHKSRLLPLPDDVSHELNCYLKACRDRRLTITPGMPLIGQSYKGWSTYSSHALLRNVRLLLKLAKIQKPDGGWPRVHDFRHSFAVNAVLRWYRSGVDVQSRLPFLSAYMGHVNIASTYYYLHFVEPLAATASNRFAKRYGALLSAQAKRKGGAR
jgi:integrase